LFEAAVRGDPPDEVAYSVMQMTPASFRGKLREAVMQPDAADKLVAAAPAFGEYRTWVQQCIEAVRAEFEPEPADGEEPEAT
jgi:hypothetical protein